MKHRTHSYEKVYDKRCNKGGYQKQCRDENSSCTNCLFATKDIALNEELRFNYGVPNLPWRKADEDVVYEDGNCGFTEQYVG
ncbi:hypothetical protein DPMN_144708 [Dreissena polymorpha]|uniref:SET domain-containing protein n=1 Tax=Dreissena polymorpha TaxID=45954 RepID=A0A9D4IWU0_DREPO|nr:hypothetical protein DPMN_144708 [Dreissena polymorpha]